jgi:sulfhydrogenase subunit gamma (sulfur reductase)
MSTITTPPGTNIYLPIKTTIKSIDALADDVRFFHLDAPVDFAYEPGQFVMVSVWGAGEVPISITSTHGVSPSLELCIRSVGNVTRAVNSLTEGSSLWIRGPYGNSFPRFNDTRDTLFVCGGIGIVPLRPLINLLLADPSKREHVSIIYGSRNPSEVLLAGEADAWSERGANVVMTVDTCTIDDWKGCKGLVTEHFGKAKVDFRNCTSYICGPHPMIQATMRDLSLMGMREDRIITTLEAHMKCGVGKCGHCYCGAKLICEEGPVFSLEEIKKHGIRPGLDGGAE